MTDNVFAGARQKGTAVAQQHATQRVQHHHMHHQMAQGQAMMAAMHQQQMQQHHHQMQMQMQQMQMGVPVMQQPQPQPQQLPQPPRDQAAPTPPARPTSAASGGKPARQETSPTAAHAAHHRAPAYQGSAAPAAPSARSKMPGNMNVLSDSMKFGKLLSRVRNDGRVYLNYKELKQCMAERALFKEKLKREINYVDSFYKREEGLLLSEGPSVVSITALVRLVLINVFACMKIVSKHERLGGLDRTCRPEILEHLHQSSFYNAFCSSPLFNQPEVALKGLTQAQLQSMSPMPTCVVCAVQTPHLSRLSSCTHNICWDCIVKKDEKGLSGCPVCGEALSLSACAVLNEDILGTEPRTLPRASRRRKHQQEGLGVSSEDDEEEQQQDVAQEAKPEGAPAAQPQAVRGPAEVEGVAAAQGEANGPAPTPAAAAPVVLEGIESDDDRTASQKNRYYCNDCSMVLNSFRQAQIHVNGQRHIDQVTRLKDRAFREGTDYTSPGLVNYTDDLKVEGHPKPRRSRGGAKNKLRAQRLQMQQQQQQGDDQQSAVSGTAGEEAKGGAGPEQQGRGGEAEMSASTSSMPVLQPYGSDKARLQQQQQQPVEQSPRSSGGGRRPTLDASMLQNSHSMPRLSSVNSMASLGDAVPGMPHVGSWGDLTGPQPTHSTVGTPGVPGGVETAFTDEWGRGTPSERSPHHGGGQHMSFQQQHYAPHQMYPGPVHHPMPSFIGPAGSQSAGPYSNQPYPSLFQYGGEPQSPVLPLVAGPEETSPDAGASSQQQQQEGAGEAKQEPGQLKAHAFQIEKHNSDLRQCIETVIAKKDQDGKAFQQIKTFVVQDDGCGELVEEIYMGIFNGENPTEYAELCKMLDQSDDPEVTLVRNEFIGLLLRKCKQTVTASILSQPTNYSMSQEQIDAIEEQELRDRFRRAAAVKFSADLFSRNILPVAVVHVCIQTMIYGQPLKAGQSGMELLEETAVDNEDNIATACRIFNTVGEKLRQVNPTFLDEYEDALTHFHSRITSSRIRRRVKDVIDTYSTARTAARELSAAGADP